MNDAEFRLLDEIESDHWWFVGKRLLLRSLLARHAPRGALLDLGCGTGGVLRDRERERSCVGMDRSAYALSVCRKKGFGRLVRADLAGLPFAPGSFDAVMALDVIEHVDDDVSLVRHAASLCRSGGAVILAVPAYELLWSRHDETFQHKRRYSAASLRRTIVAAGLVTERITHTNAFVFPIALVWRLLTGRGPLRERAPAHDFVRLPAALNHLLIAVYRLEAWLVRRFDLPVGVSLVAVARRP